MTLQHSRQVKHIEKLDSVAEYGNANILRTSSQENVRHADLIKKHPLQEPTTSTGQPKSVLFKTIWEKVRDKMEDK